MALAGETALTAKLLTKVFAAAVIFSAVFLAPASLINPFIQPTDVDFEKSTGRIWNGQLVGVSVNGVALGDVAFDIRPLRLLTGQLAARVNVANGPATASGDVAYGLMSGSTALSDANFYFNLASIRNYSIFGVPYEGDMTGTVKQLNWSKSGCQHAELTITTSLLDRAARQFANAPLTLSGPGFCDGDNLAVNLTGANATGEVSVALSVNPNATYQLTAAVEPNDGRLGEALQIWGFETDGAVFVYDAIGELKGIGS